MTLSSSLSHLIQPAEQVPRRGDQRVAGATRHSAPCMRPPPRPRRCQEGQAVKAKRSFPHAGRARLVSGWPRTQDPIDRSVGLQSHAAPLAVLYAPVVSCCARPIPIPPGPQPGLPSAGHRGPSALCCRWPRQRTAGPCEGGRSGSAACWDAVGNFRERGGGGQARRLTLWRERERETKALGSALAVWTACLRSSKGSIDSGFSMARHATKAAREIG